jgi:hypothetical protein
MLSRLRTFAPLSVNSAKGLARWADRSFASLRMTGSVVVVILHNRRMVKNDRPARATNICFVSSIAHCLLVVFNYVYSSGHVTGRQTPA